MAAIYTLIVLKLGVSVFKGGILIYRGLLVIGLLLLSACVPMTQTAPVVSAQGPLSAAERQERVIDRLLWQAVDRLLWQAERALQADRLMTPAADNAYDRFQAVLLMRPEHSAARTGLQLIVMRYIELGRDALARQRMEDVERYLARAEAVGLGRELIEELRAQRDQQRVLQRRVAVQQDGLLGDRPRLMLSADTLNDRGPPLQAQLRVVAERIGKSHESLLIVARNDGEGRWLYKQIKSLLVGYRLRGDIRVGKEAYLEFQAPLD